MTVKVDESKTYCNPDKIYNFSLKVCLEGAFERRVNWLAKWIDICVNYIGI